MGRGNANASTAQTSALGNNSAANALSGQGVSLSQGAQNRGNSLYSSLAPELQSEVTSPTGYNPTDLAKMNTGAQQTEGGANAGAVGQGALLSSRTRNAGAGGAAIAESSRAAGQNLGQAGLAIAGKNADLKEKQKQAGLSAQEGLYGQQAAQALGGLNAATGALSAGNGALGQVANNVNANTQAEQASWDWSKYLLSPLLSAGSQSKYF